MSFHDDMLDDEFQDEMEYMEYLIDEDERRHNSCMTVFSDTEWDDSEEREYRRRKNIRERQEAEQKELEFKEWAIQNWDQFRLFHSKFYNGFIHSYLIYNSELKICEDALHLRLTRFVNSMGNGHTMSDDYYFEWNQWKRERKEYLKFKEENTSEWRKFKTSILLRHKLKLLKDVSECFTKCFDPNGTDEFIYRQKGDTQKIFKVISNWPSNILSKKLKSVRPKKEYMFLAWVEHFGDTCDEEDAYKLWIKQHPRKWANWLKNNFSQFMHMAQTIDNWLISLKSDENLINFNKWASRYSSRWRKEKRRLTLFDDEWTMRELTHKVDDKDILRLMNSNHKDWIWWKKQIEERRLINEFNKIK